MRTELLEKLHELGPSPDVIENAIKFIHFIPNDIQSPEVGVTEAGDVTFDWSTGPLQSMTALVDDSGNVCAGVLFGDFHEEWNSLLDNFFCTGTKKLIGIAIDETIAGFEDVGYKQLLVRRK